MVLPISDLWLQSYENFSKSGRKNSCQRKIPIDEFMLKLTAIAYFCASSKYFTGTPVVVWVHFFNLKKEHKSGLVHEDKFKIFTGRPVAEK